MKRALCGFGIGMVLAIVLARPVAAQEKKESAPGQGQEQTMPKPGPAHEVLKKDVGVWDATVESTMEPGGKPVVTKGVETNIVIGEGLWLIQDFKGEFFGAPFRGHGVTGYDTGKKKYVGTWVDTMTTAISTVEGTYDAATNTMTGTMESPGPGGTMMKMRSTSQWKDENTRIFTMYAPNGQGGEFAMMKITYKRQPPPPPRATSPSD
jgi:hypothetical protein